MTRVVLRPATAADLDALVAEPLPYRVRAFAAFLTGGETAGETLLGAGGLAFLPATVAAFLILKPGASRYRVALHKAGLRVMDEARRLGIARVVALADPRVVPAARWLERLGFREIMVDGEKAYVWQTRSP